LFISPPLDFAPLNANFLACNPAAPLHQGAPLSRVQPSNYSYTIYNLWWVSFFSRLLLNFAINLFCMYLISAYNSLIFPVKYMYDNFHFFKSKAEN
jgi:hypothetical protein